MRSFVMAYRRPIVAVFHLTTFVLALVIAFLLRFDFSVPASELRLLYAGIAIAVPVKMLVFYRARLFQGWWQYAGVHDLLTVYFANLIGSVIFGVLSIAVIGWGFPRSAYVLDFILSFLMTAGMRFVVRLYNEALRADMHKRHGRNVLIYGAGSAGVRLLRELRSNASLGYEAVGFVDDDLSRHGFRVHGLSVLGTGRDLASILEMCSARGKVVDEVVIALATATGNEMREAVANCRATGVPCKTIPGIGELLEGKFLTDQIRNVSVEDLLGRKPVFLEEKRIRESISERVVLVTGAAGSIGSELCRQVAAFGPSHLIAFDKAESDLFRIEMELRQRYPALQLTIAVGDICDAQRLEEVMWNNGVTSIIHAAAYKHVPLMEAHAIEAVKNNVLGTWNLLRTAQKAHVRSFLMISTDKAVNPTSVMGATKRAAELMVSGMPSGSGRGDTQYVAVRFGNVLGSNGSVVTVFQSQIAAGGPVTVTHPDVRRYFMTVREAVQLVLQASTMGKGSEIFVLDMGDPIKIVDLAKNMIRLSGLVPDQEIEIRFTGLRPGERLYEELGKDSENLLPTYHEKISIYACAKEEFHKVEAWVQEMQRIIATRNEHAVIEHLHKFIPEYQPSRMWTERRSVASTEQVRAVSA